MLVFPCERTQHENPLVNSASTAKLFFVCLDELRRHIHREREAREKAERQCAALQRGKGENVSLLNAIHFFQCILISLSIIVLLRCFNFPVFDKPSRLPLS